MPKRQTFWWNVAQNSGLAVTAGVILANNVRRQGPWYFAVALAFLAGYALLSNLWPRRRPQLYLAAETLIIIGLLVLDPMALLLCFILSARVMILLPRNLGLIWLAYMTLVSGIIFASLGLQGLISAAAAAVGYISFGYAHYSRHRAERAHRQSQELLEELQQAHQQLQRYTEQAQDLAVAEERSRLAREMHDTLGHRLTVAAVQLEGAQRLIPQDPERAGRMVGTVREQVKQALAELRHTVATLRTPLESGQPLDAALRRLAASFAQGTGLQVHLDLEHTLPALPAAYRLVLYRTAQEALTNVQRHARAEEAWLRLHLDGGEIVLQADDDGRGAPETGPQAGFGLRGIAERAGQLGGRLELGPRPGGGARLSLHLPWPAEVEHD